MKVTIEKIKTFGQGVKAYRIVPEKEGAVPSGPPTELEHPIRRTANAKRLGDELRKQFQDRV